MDKFELYILDFDGTLIDSFEGLKIFYRKAFEIFGVTLTDEDCYNFMKMSLDDAFMSKVGRIEDIKKFSNRCYEIVSTDILLKHNVPYPDALKFLDYTKKNNIKTALVTGNSNQHIYKVFKYNNIDLFTDCIICSEDLTKQKPDPEGLLLALSRTGYLNDKKKACYVGDAWNDYIASKGAGVTSVLVDRHNEFPDSKDYIRITNLEELMN